MKYVQILLFGICLGFPINSLILLVSVIWCTFNRDAINRTKNKVYETIDRKQMKLDTGITYDYLQTKKASRKIAGKIRDGTGEFSGRVLKSSFYRIRFSRFKRVLFGRFRKSMGKIHFFGEEFLAKKMLSYKFRR